MCHCTAHRHQPNWLFLQALLSDPPPDPDACRRLDLTHLTVYTVDDASTTEVDDGLSVTTDEAGNRLLWVHVADPTRWITPGGTVFAGM